MAELTTNSVVHGGGHGTLAIWSDAGQVVCEVRDAVRLGSAGRPPAPGARGRSAAGLLSSTTSPIWCGCTRRTTAPPSAPTSASETIVGSRSPAMPIAEACVGAS
ncbi:hypothetical protein LV779_08855 [Streptomyces thinghirensis]|nr:hypothetical protein [Streptomyces thinghirensis]